MTELYKQADEELYAAKSRQKPASDDTLARRAEEFSATGTLSAKP
jgi:hypothetical protein